MNRKAIFAVAIAVATIFCVGLSIMENQTKLVSRAYDNFILDNKDHYLSCDQLPSETEVSRILAEHQDVVQRIEQVNPGYVGVEMDAGTCPGKADILIWFGTHQDRELIEKIIGGETFFGIPYRLQNR
jgi:hypothetical protein